MKKTITLILITCMAGSAIAQPSLWSDKPETEMNPGNAESRKLFPNQYRTVELNVEGMRTLLASAPDEVETVPTRSEVMMEIPTPDGRMDTFSLVRYSMMEPELASRYPDIQTLRGVSIHDPFKTIRCDWTVKGFSAMISSREGRYHIEPYARENQEEYLIFFKLDYPQPTEPFSCGTKMENPDEVQQQSRVSGDCTFRSYRLAVATTGEYSNYFGADGPEDAAIVLSEVVTTVNRLNDVYEKDVTVRFILIASTTNVFYYNGASDPYSGSVCNYLNQNQTVMTEEIGGANYDFGHVYGLAANNGCAGLSVICSSSNKARGATVFSIPEGDPFVIDYVAHEMGHQFGANHTQNNDCNDVAATRMEPGSASTIMGYAGICSPNVQSNSDDYFHGISVQEINNYISASTGNTCDVPIAWSNSAPVLTGGADYTIPISTPFALTAVASDPNNDPITYCWEQWDNEVGSMPPSSTNTFGPMFRTFDPSSSETRYFPRLQDLVNNVSPTWEVLPSVTRNMEFRVTIRDFHNGLAGCTDEDNINVNTTSTAGPFVVTSPNTSTIDWSENTNHTVTWNVANTTAAPVSCANVDIFLSYDGGLTYPVTLLSNTPNDGSQSVLVPFGTTTMARVMVKGRNHVFFDISNQNFDIISTTPTYALMATPTSQVGCSPGIVVYVINVQSINGYLSPVTLSLTGQPAGSIVVFSVNPIIPGNASQLGITLPAGITPGNYLLTINGVSAAGPKSTTATLVIPASLTVPTLVSPEDEEIGVPVNAILDWAASTGASYYEVELATDAAFNSIVFEDTTIATMISTGTLDEETTYYWRVRAANACATSAWSPTREFETARCDLSYSTDVPVAIPNGGTPTITSDLVWTISGEIVDINVIDLTGTHSYLGELRFILTSPSATNVVLIDQWCTFQNNFDINLDDEAAPGLPPCPYNNGNTYQPEEPLAAFIGEEAQGTWVLTVQDLAAGDGGSLNIWALEICVAGGCFAVVTSNADSGDGTLRDALDCASAGDTITFAPALFGSTIGLLTPLLIKSDIHILSTPVENITFDASHTTRALQINALTEVTIAGITIIGGSALTGCGIQNSGELLLKNVTINPGLQPAQPLIANLGALTLEGNCQISQ